MENKFWHEGKVYFGDLKKRLSTPLRSWHNLPFLTGNMRCKREPNKSCMLIRRDTLIWRYSQISDQKDSGTWLCSTHFGLFSEPEPKARVIGIYKVSRNLLTTLTRIRNIDYNIWNLLSKAYEVPRQERLGILARRSAIEILSALNLIPQWILGRTS